MRDAEPEIERAGERAYLSVFRPATASSGWPLGAIANEEPFRATIAARGVLCPMLWDLDQRTVEAIVRAAKAIGDKGLFHVFVERLNGDEQLRQLGPPIAYYTFGDQPLMVRSSGALVTALVSESGAWGVQFSDTDWAVVGGSTPFMQVLNEDLTSPLKAQMHTLLAAWVSERQRHGTSCRTWAAGFLRHLVGRDHADELLKSYDI